MSVFLGRAVARRAPLVLDQAARHLLQDALTTEDEFEATDNLVLELDRHLAAGNTELFASVLELADCDGLRLSVLGGLLLLAKAARPALGERSAAFTRRALAALERRLPASDSEAIRKQFS